MKKALLFIFLVVVVTSVQAQKIAHINSTELMTLMPDVAEVEKKLQEYGQSLEETNAALLATYEEKMQYYQDNQHDMEEFVKETKVKEIQTLEERIHEFQGSAQKVLETRKQEMYEPILKKAKDAIEAVGNQYGYTYILDTSLGVVLYMGDDAVDIMPLVKKHLGI